MKSYILLKLLLFAGLVLCEPDRSKRSKLEYSFTYPQSMISGEKVKACLTLNNAKLPGRLTVSFNTSRCGIRNQSKCEFSYQVNKDYECFDLTAPNRIQESRYHVNTESLEIKLDVKGEKITKRAPQDIVIVGGSEFLFVETDRGRYKPGDLVRIRILAWEYDFTPVVKKKISKLTLTNPKGNKVKVWENVTTTTGLAQVEYQLQDSAPTGSWSLNVDGKDYVGFKVETYILERFTTTFEYPKSFYIADKTIDIKLCAKYSYGKDIKGRGTVQHKSDYYHNDQQNAPLSKSQELKNGCAFFRIQVSDLALNKSINYYSFDGIVTEQGTGETQTVTGYIFMATKPYYIQFGDNENRIKPGLPYKGTLEIKEKKISLKGIKIKLCYEYYEDWNVTEILDCQAVLIDDKDKIKFTIPPLKRISKGHFFIDFNDTVKTPYYSPYGRYTLIQSYSDSNNSLQITRNDTQEIRHCGDYVTFTILYTVNKLTDKKIDFTYLLLSKYDVVKTGYVKVKAKGQYFDPSTYENVFKGKNKFTETGMKIGEFKLRLKLHGQIYSDARLVVFYVTNGEIIADETIINIEKCLPNKVDIKWNKDTFEPAEKASLKISTGKGSLCALTAIDQASTFKWLPYAVTVDNIITSTEYARYHYHSTDERDCIKPKEALEEAERDLGIESSTIPESYFWSVPNYKSDANTIFRQTNIGIITNQKIITMPCQRYKNNINTFWSPGSVTVPAFTALTDPTKTRAGVDQQNKSTKETTMARTYFPETWLWDLVPADGGYAFFERNLPDTITNWTTKALCLSRLHGVGSSRVVELNVFKPFFVDPQLPYSIKRNTEILQLPVVVYNYLNESIPLRLTLGDNVDLQLVDGANKKTVSVCVAAGDSKTHIYRIKALKIGTLNISVSAELDPRASGNCGNKNVVLKKDVVYKTVRVEAEGYPSNIVKSTLLCANDSLGTNNVSWDIRLPKDVVKDTVVGSITINSDILGPVIQNLDRWLRDSSGTGEKTMASLVPNLYVLRYLKANNALTKEIQDEAVKNLEIGYQRILGYAHEDGSFSAFGEADKEGSTFLTAFVVRTLRLIKEYIKIDDDVINKAVTWISKQQRSNGCFNAVSHVLDRLEADSDKVNQTTILTSYVLISLIETKINVSSSLLLKGKQCILRGDKSDNYTLAISAYSLALNGSFKDADQILKKLLKAADVQDGTIFWRQSQLGWPSVTQDVEVAGYALLALLQRGTPEYIEYAASVVRFLQTQINAEGTYYSSQGSVVALDGLSRFANIVNKDVLNLDIAVTTRQSGNHNLQMRQRFQNSKLEIRLEKYPELVKIKVKGSGCVLGQVVVKFNLNEKPKSKFLKLKVTTKSATNKTQCILLQVISCVSYNSKGQSNMVLLEVSLPSGYIPDEASLYALKGSVPDVKKFEIIQNKIVIYVNRLTSTEVCTPFIIQETVVVENRVDPTVKLYDYYNPDVSVSQRYKLPKC